ncbi:hypothetical protein ANN_01694 [Periplaneta americana]|uniref:Uncharacterized protein n=1 Tax=Periplaneta americana TaxID=6978 RepID=A0ABQ8TXN5_PERAM|nr:hypothetical protein ANN_01694 [Periplaneta americana]
MAQVAFVNPALTDFLTFLKFYMSVVMSSSEESFDLSSSSDSASGDNDILSSIPQLSDELEFFGLRPLPNVKNDGSRLVIQTQVASLVSALIDAVWNLLHLHQSTIRQNDEAEDRRHRLADDNKNLRAQVDRLKTELVGKEKVLSVANEKERRLTSECDKLQTDLRKEKDEVRRLVSQVAQRDSQHIHELRKKENEVLQVQEQLRQNLGLSRVTRHISKQESNKKSPHESCSDNTCDMPAKSRGEPTICETWTLTLRQEHRLRVFENKVLRKIFGAKRDAVTGEWRKLHNTELHALYSSPDIIRKIKSRRLRWTGHIARMGESRNAYRVSEEQEELYRKVIYKFESNNHSLIQENISLRETYCKLHNELGLVTQQFVVLMEKYFKSTKTSENGEDKNMLKILPSSIFQMPYDGVKEYNKELHLMSDRYVAMLQAVLEKISNYLESRHSI